MNYLYGDSSESDLEFNYLAFIREVVDAAVVLLEHEAALGSNDRRRAKEKDSTLTVQSIEELGRHAAALFDPVIKEYAETPVGRAASSITTAVRDVIAAETAKVKAALVGELELLGKEADKLRARSIAQLDKLLRAYDLPDATRSYDVAWTTGAPKKLVLTQHASFGVEAVFDAPVPPGSPFGAAELRVDKFADNVEINSLEVGGWIKKSDKLVPYKLGRYFITRASVTPSATTLRLRMTQEANASGFNLVSKAGDLTLEKVGDAHDKDKATREYSIDDKNRPGLKQLVDKIEATAREIIGEGRTLVSISIDHKPLAEHAHPQVLAERLINSIAPTVKEIAAHSPNPNELVLRRMLGDDRREEIFISTAELAKKIEAAPEAARNVFAPLGIERRGAARPKPVTVKPPTVATVRTIPPRPPPASTSVPATVTVPDGIAVARVHSDTIDLSSVEEIEASLDEGTQVGRPKDDPTAAVAAPAPQTESSATKRPAMIIAEHDDDDDDDDKAIAKLEARIEATIEAKPEPTVEAKS